jgi:hypothetical protein
VNTESIFGFVPVSEEDWLVILVPLAAAGTSVSVLITRRRCSRPRISLLWRDIGAIFLTPLVWPIGVALLWTSRSWSRVDKTIATVVIPGGYALAWSTLGVRSSAAVPEGGVPPGWTPPSAPLHSWASPGVVHVVGGLVLIIALLLPSIIMLVLASRIQVPAIGGGVESTNSCDAGPVV